LAEITGVGPGPLAGLRVIDATKALSGPFCTMTLADLGADVIKVEPPGGDPTRGAPPFTADDPVHSYGGYFASVNRGKRSIVLDLKQTADREIFLRLVDGADVVVENSRAGAMDRLGVGYEMLAARNPKLVYAAIRGFGDPRTGASPYVDWPSYDVVAQAMGGLVSITGLLDGTLVKCGPSIGDIYTGSIAAIGVLAALLHARSTGEGQFVDVAMYDAVLSLCENAVVKYSYTADVQRPSGNGHPGVPAFEVFATSDGHCAIGATTDASFELLCELLGAPELATDERFRTFTARMAHRATLTDELEHVTVTKSTAEIVAALGGRVPVGPVNDMAAIFADPHVAARDMLVTIEQPDGSRPVQLAGQPIKMTRGTTTPTRRPPRLDEHRADILGDVGISCAAEP
jgi:crotonobetainyl-CoA:carnitine CoA-transferase CaiB-like acyl-CoA transferase